jgi:uncharacterized protein YndB with AHSA1/START domain
MPVFGSELFRIITPASPQCVWQALTATGEPVNYLYGLAVQGRWRPGSAITLGVAAGPHLRGEVLRADPPRLLTYTLGDTANEPSVFVTWEIDVEADGTIVRLYVDEVDPSTSADIEVAWLPVLTALQRRLQHGEEPRFDVRGA